MKLLLSFFSILAMLTYGCSENVSNNCSYDSQLGLLGIYRPPLINVGSLALGNEIDIGINVLWTDGCIYESYFEVEKRQGLTYKVTLKNRSKGCLCTDDIRQGSAPFKFKPTQKGLYTFVVIDRKDTIISEVVVN